MQEMYETIFLGGNYSEDEHEHERGCETETSASPVDGVDRGWRRTGQPCAGVVVPDGLDDARHHRAQHADDARRGYRGDAPLNCGRHGRSVSSPSANKTTL